MSSSGHKVPDAEPARLGIIGGSGLERFDDIEVEERIRLDTPYGPPSDEVILGRLNGQRVAFIPRHGASHALAPSRVPYKANLAALKLSGARTVVATCIVGSLKSAIEPGDFVVPDQFVNATWGRDGDSIEPDGSFMHLAMKEPYCQALREELVSALREEGIACHPTGTTVVIQGPRFSTRAESEAFIGNGWDIVNMTQYPECLFARELGLCYGVMASVTDWDVGVARDRLQMRPEMMGDVLKVFRRNTTKTRLVLASLSRRLAEFSCGCARKETVEYYQRN